MKFLSIAPIALMAAGALLAIAPQSSTFLNVGYLSTPADVSITKTDGRTNVDPGDLVTYTITLTNLTPGGGYSTVTVVDTMPSALTNVSWTCAHSAIGYCLAPSGTGDINSLSLLIFGETTTYTVSGTLSMAPGGTIANTATVTPMGFVDPFTGNNSATDTNYISGEVTTTTTVESTTTAAPTTTEAAPTTTEAAPTTTVVVESAIAPTTVPAAIALQAPTSTTAASTTTVATTTTTTTTSAPAALALATLQPVPASVVAALPTSVPAALAAKPTKDRNGSVLGNGLSGAGDLSYTGSNTIPTTAIGFAMIALGAALAMFSRQKRNTTSA